jgi:serine protease Do
MGKAMFLRRLGPVGRKRLRGLVLTAALAGLAGAAAAQEASEVPSRTSATFLKPFRPAVARASRATVRVRCDGKDVALGAVAAADGWVLTKASDLHGTTVCVFAVGKELPARVGGVHEPFDLALLKVEATGLTSVEWLPSSKVRPGDWLVTPGPDTDPAAVGVVSVATRKLSPREAGPMHSGRGAFLGVVLGSGREGLKVEEVVPDSPAAKAGLREEDYLLALNGKQLEDTEALQTLLQKAKPGDTVRLKVRRGEEELELKATLERRQTGRGDALAAMSGKLSQRRTGFSVILQHDTILRPEDCGGPVVNLDGKTVGINIARAGRVESYAIPSEAILPILEELKNREQGTGNKGQK